MTTSAQHLAFKNAVVLIKTPIFTIQESGFKPRTNDIDLAYFKFYFQLREVEVCIKFLGVVGFPIAVMLLSILTLGILLLWVQPYMEVAVAEFYRNLKGEQDILSAETPIIEAEARPIK